MPYTVLYRRWARQRALLAGIARREPTRDTGSEEQRMLKQLRLRGASQIDGKHVGPLCEDVQYQAESPGRSTALLARCQRPVCGPGRAASDAESGLCINLRLSSSTYLPFFTHRRYLLRSNTFIINELRFLVREMVERTVLTVLKPG